MTGDKLFSTIESWQGGGSWGSVLDAGTGDHSLSWIVERPTTRWTAVTGDERRAVRMQSHFVRRMRSGDAIVSGNWENPSFRQGQTVDVVLADYLLGAVDGFAPYFQSELFARLRPLVGQKLFVVGLEPYQDPASSEGGRLVVEVARLRDACILLAGHRCYREYPLEWVERSLDRAGFRVERSLRFPINYRKRFVKSQLEVCRRKLPHFSSRALAREMEGHIDDVEQRGLRLLEEGGGSIPFGSDYVVMAVPRSSNSKG